MNRLNIEATEFIEHFFNGQISTKFGYRIYDNFESSACDDFDSIEQVLESIRPGNLLQTITTHTPNWYGLITDPLSFTGYSIGGYEYSFKELARFFPDYLQKSLSDYL